MDTQRQVERASGDAVCYTGIMRAEEEEEEDDGGSSFSSHVL